MSQSRRRSRAKSCPLILLWMHNIQLIKYALHVTC
uniref:Uncharacterized protein n=1 Tax=Anguilla anguilla TaxID=7936 RepID=A0A0E9PGY4_ANGAN